MNETGFAVSQKLFIFATSITTNIFTDMNNPKRSFAAVAVVVMAAAMMAGCCNGGIEEQRFMGMAGKPKSVKITVYEAVEKLGDALPLETVMEERLYDFTVDGQQQTMVMYNSDGDVVFSIIHYFEDGRCIETSAFHYGKLVDTRTFESGTKKSYVWKLTASDGTVTTLHTERGENKMTTVEKDAAGNAVSKGETTYDCNGNIIEYSAYDAEGELAYRTLSTFDDDSREITKKMWHGGVDSGEYSYSYETFDDNGNWTKRIDRLNGEIESVTMREITY